MEGFCRISIAFSGTKRELEQTLSLPDWLDAYVGVNTEYSAKLQKAFPDGFLYFKYSVELEFLEEKKAALIEEINKALSTLLKLEIPAVVACDFEAELDNSGGYNRKDMPWPR